MKYIIPLVVLFAVNASIFAQDIDYIRKLDTIYLYFKEDGKFQLKNDKYLSQKMLKDSIVIYDYDVKGRGMFYTGDFRFINKNFNDAKTPTKRPLSIKKSFVRKKKNQIVSIDFFKKYGYRESYFAALERKKALFIIEEKNNKLILLEVETFFSFPYEQ